MKKYLPRKIFSGAVTLLAITGACAGPTDSEEKGTSTGASTGTSTETSDTETSTTSSGQDEDGSCTALSNTTATSTKNSFDCALLTRDTSSCKSDREAQGLSGFWLNFSCNVTLTKNASTIYLNTEGLPDYKTYYWGSSHACYDSFNTLDSRSPNPGSISDISATVEVPASPEAKSGSKTATELGTVGLAVNGVLIFNDQASPDDNIYDEVSTFDSCEGHPALTHYHYHIEPPSISNNDSNLIGVMRDGFPIYGKKDASGSTPTLDSYGGHVGPLPSDTSTEMYHYHLTLVSGTDGTGTQAEAYFLKSDAYYGTPGTTCENCMPTAGGSGTGGGTGGKKGGK